MTSRIAFAIATLILGCNAKTEKLGGLSTDAGASQEDASMRMGTSFPCNDAGGALWTDPNNCNACGVMCGTWVNSLGKGYNFQQSACVKTTPIANVHIGVCTGSPEQVVQTPATPCYDGLSPGNVVNTKTVGFQHAVDPTVFYGCINILTDPNNCGGLDHVCGYVIDGGTVFTGNCINGLCQ